MAKRFKEHQYDDSRKERKGKTVKKFKEKQRKTKHNEKPKIDRKVQEFPDELLVISEGED